jgi:hypothetical protein
MVALLVAGCSGGKGDPYLAALQRDIGSPVTAETFAIHMADCAAVHDTRRSDPPVVELRARCAKLVPELVALSPDCIDACRAARFADRKSYSWPEVRTRVAAMCAVHPCDALGH